MIRCRSIGPRQDALPAAKRRSGQPIRLLLLASTALGFRNDFDQILFYLDRDNRFDTWAIELTRSPLQRALSLSSGATSRWDFFETRIMRLWEIRLRSWFRGPLPLSRFDLALVINQTQGLALARQVEIPFVACLDATLPANAREFPNRSGHPRSALHLERQVLEKARLVVCRNGWSASSVAADHGIDESRIHVAPSSMRLSEVAKQAEKDTLPRLLFVGHAWRRKGGSELLRLHQEHFSQRCTLHIVSGQAKPSPSAHNVVWHGALPRRQILEVILPQADLLVLPSHRDMAPWAVLEAAMAGLPVIATRIAAIPEYVRHGETGLLFAPGDWQALAGAIDRMISDPQLRTSFGDAAQRIAHRDFDADRNYPELLDRLASLLS